MTIKYKIICCPCFDQRLSSCEYVDKNNYFNCLYDSIHDVYVLTCSHHPFVHNLKKDSTWFCKNLHGSQICGSCLEKRLVLNCEAKKYCFKKLSDFIDGLIIGFEQF